MEKKKGSHEGGGGSGGGGGGAANWLSLDDGGLQNRSGSLRNGREALRQCRPSADDGGEGRATKTTGGWVEEGRGDGGWRRSRDGLKWGMISMEQEDDQGG